MFHIIQCHKLLRSLSCRIIDTDKIVQLIFLRLLNTYCKFSNHNRYYSALFLIIIICQVPLFTLEKYYIVQYKLQRALKSNKLKLFLTFINKLYEASATLYSSLSNNIVQIKTARYNGRRIVYATERYFKQIATRSVEGIILFHTLRP